MATSKLSKAKETKEEKYLKMWFSLVLVPKTTKCMGNKYLMSMICCINLVFLSLINPVMSLLKRRSNDNIHGGDQEEEVRENYVLLMDGMCPMPIPVPVHQLTALVKKTLPVVKYETLRIRHRLQQEQEEEEILMCPVCLEGIKGYDEIRLLRNCSHFFHRECVDRWMDEDRVSCPSCRSTLYPTKIGIRDLWAGRW